MFEKIIKNEEGSALVFVMILIANAIIITASIVFISAVQNRSSSALTLTPVAFQRADSGLEYILREINHVYDPSDDIDDLCDNFNAATRKCTINDPKVSAYFLDENEDVLAGNDVIDDVKYIKVVGEIGSGINRFSRSLQVTLFTNPI